MNSKLNKNEIFIFLFLGIFVVLAWLNILDKEAYVLNLSSLKEVSIALVSVKTMEAVMGAVSGIPLIGGMIGGVLEPFKGFFEQVSGLLTISLMSLGLQKVIIMTMQSVVLNLFISVAFVLTIIFKIGDYVSTIFYNKFFKFLLILLFIRFAIPVMTFATLSIESGVQKMQQEVSQERLNELQEQVSKLNELASDEEKANLIKEQELTEIDNSINKIKLEKINLTNEIKEIKEDQKNYLEAENDSMIKRISSLITTKELKTEALDRIKIKDNRIKEIDNEVIEKEASRKSIEKNYTSGVSKTIKVLMVNIKTYMENSFDILVTMSILFFFKNVLLPIFFIWVLFRMIDKSFNTNNEKFLKKYI